MVKGIILDVDGVIVGEKIGFNSPWPHPEVIKKLKDIKSKGVFISLSTAKAHFAIDKIINDAGLDNLHITELERQRYRVDSPTESQFVFKWIK